MPLSLSYISTPNGTFCNCKNTAKVRASAGPSMMRTIAGFAAQGTSP